VDPERSGKKYRGKVVERVLENASLKGGGGGSRSKAHSPKIDVWRDERIAPRAG